MGHQFFERLAGRHMKVLQFELAQSQPNLAIVVDAGLCARRLDDGIGRREVDGIHDGCGWARRLMGLSRSAWAKPWRNARRGGAVG